VLERCPRQTLLRAWGTSVAPTTVQRRGRASIAQGRRLCMGRGACKGMRDSAENGGVSGPTPWVAEQPGTLNAPPRSWYGCFRVSIIETRVRRGGPTAIRARGFPRRAALRLDGAASSGLGVWDATGAMAPRPCRSQRLPWRGCPRTRFPPLSWGPGHRPAHAASGLARGKRLRAMPSAALRLAAARCPTPGLVSRRAMAAWAAARRCAIAPRTRALASSQDASALQGSGRKKLGGAVPRPSQASLRWSRFARRRPRATAARASTARWPARSAAPRARAEPPALSGPTAARGPWASSQTAGHRWSARAGAWTSGRRSRVRCRPCPGGGATAPPPPAMAEQLHDPGRVWHVRLPSGDGRDGLGRHAQAGARACAPLGDRPPVHARAVHGHLQTAGRLAPGGPRPQGGGQRPPRPARRAGLLPLGTGAAARHARLWVEGEPAALGSAHRQRPPPGVLTPHGLRVGGRSAAACWRRAQRQPVVPPRPPVLRLAGGRPEKLPPGGGRRSGAQPRPWHRPGRGAPS